MNKVSSEAATLPVTAPKAASPVVSRNMVVGILAALALVVGSFYGVKRWHFLQAHEETDDAQVEGDISPVLPRVSGYITSILVKDNEHVVAGQPLIEIDSRELDLKVAAAEAALQNAKADRSTADASLAAARAALSTAHANVDTARVRERKAKRDLERDSALFKTGAITESQLSDTQAAADTTAAQLAAAESEAASATSLISVAEARVAASQTLTAEKASDLDYAKLQRSYATVTAPIAGLVSRKNVELGQLVQSGQNLLSIASDSDVWVVGNFKETQLTSMKAGQAADFEADSYPNVVFHGKVESIAGATGARFALLPPDNASGNFVKVTQRVPVKIVLDQAPDTEHPLRPGMSVDVAVQVR